jgi:aspartate kinase
MTVAMKFGGSSVADADAIRRVAAIVARQQRSGVTGERSPVVVVSALGGVTDRLVEVSRVAQDGDSDRAVALLHELRDRHVAVASALTSGHAQADLLAQLRREFDELIGLVHALAVLHEVSPRSLDAVLAGGELLSSRIVAAALSAEGVAATWVDARTVVVTDAEHTGAAPDMAATRRRATAVLVPIAERGEVAVLGGFIGATPNHVTTTLGRGGSDFSAAIVGACLDVDEIQIWTDVDGMLTADPRIVPHPTVVPRLSFAEASELAYFGAKVLHPSTILPAVSNNIPVRIVNSRRPDGAGTLITADARQPDGQLTAIACKREVTVVDITSTRMLMAHGFLRRVFEVFERFKTAVDVVTTSEVSVSVTVDDVRRLDAVVDNLKHFAEVGIEREMAIVCVVGENLRADPTLFSRAVTALDRIPLRLVSQAASRRNITFVLRDTDVSEAMGRLHNNFFRSAIHHENHETHEELLTTKGTRNTKTFPL